MKLILTLKTAKEEALGGFAMKGTQLLSGTGAVVVYAYKGQ